MCVQNSHYTGCAFQLFVIQAKGVERSPRTLKQLLIKHPLVRPGQWSEFFGQGKSDHEIIDGQLFLALPLYPLLTLVILAMRATAVSTRMWYISGLITIEATDFH